MKISRRTRYASNTFDSVTYTELNAMTKLLDDPDHSVFEQLEISMLRAGYQMIPLLEIAYGESTNALVKTRIEQVIDKINFSGILEEFNIWNTSREADILELMILINRLQYPAVNCKPFENLIEDHVKGIWLELNENLTAFERINVINRMVFEIWKFKSVNDYSHDLFQFNFLSNLMEKSYGNQFSMACFYLILTEKLNLPVYPVLLEDQLILTYLNTHRPPEEAEFENIMFYINPNEEGVVFDESSIRKWVEKHRLENRAGYYLPVSNKQLANAYIERLIAGYEVEKDDKKIDFLSTLKV